MLFRSTICADGTSVASTIIYKGEAFQTKWLWNNPLNARFPSFPKIIWVIKSKVDSRMGYQKKGYTLGEIGVAWLKDWDKQTKAKAGAHT